MTTHVICRHGSEGPRLQVPNLNEIQVLIDRSETRFTELGLNTWRAGLFGPPHNHEAKEQIFYITSGSGWVAAGEERFSVQSGDSVYIPPLVVHQTVAGQHGPLTYILFNAFLDDTKEGHASFEEHVKALGETCLRQAAMKSANVDSNADFRSSSERALHISGTMTKAPSARTRETINVLDKSATKRSAAQIAIRPPHVKEEMSPDHGAEQTIYILSGSAQIEATDRAIEVSHGYVVFVPAENGLTINAGANGVTWLSLRTYLNSAR